MDYTPYLYLLIRNDLHSLNPGKAVAHGAHAANQFVFNVHRMAELENREEKSNGMFFDHLQLLKEWENSADGFGTTITLSVSFQELTFAVRLAKSMGYAAGETVDPTYPYILDKEYADLIKHLNEHPPTPLPDGKVLCFRQETTAGYVFGPKGLLKPVVGNFPLMA